MQRPWLLATSQLFPFVEVSSIFLSGLGGAGMFLTQGKVGTGGKLRRLLGSLGVSSSVPSASGS